MTGSGADIGIFGLGTMGSALALNFAGQGFTVAVANREKDLVSEFLNRSGELKDRVVSADTPADLVQALTPPRVVLLMIPSGAPVEQMIAVFEPLLEKGDVLIDAGNSDFHDTNRRARAFADKGLEYVGLGVSGGEEGALTGPSMMFGGSEEAWTRLGPLLEKISAKFDGDPCVARMGPDGAGHFVKTMHNGIEYADMQMIAEAYGLLRDGTGLAAPEIGALFREWEAGPLASYLVEATAQVLLTTDPESGNPLVDRIEDRAGQKGTGRWSVIAALHLGQSASTIEAAVAARAWSSDKSGRLAAERVLPGPDPAGSEFRVRPIDLAEALYAGRILAHAQGFEVLQAASAEFGWSLNLARIAEIWRAGCIIRSRYLDVLATALKEPVPEGGLLLTPGLRAELALHLPALRRVVTAAMTAGLPVPALAAAVGWYDSLRRGRGSTNLIQAQRDAFGRHGFERIDRSGLTHGIWTGE
ncbi:NADP-dependent phosphogluconate dehydrogenase [Primorskyibacter sp. S87]|uniref:NADP-dependent phosphogluconate dehydrogenase n=1 Tax=Primorskyibacter sp. S87 TaxID=3415126 RepID=UPI003C7E3D6A